MKNIKEYLTEILPGETKKFVDVINALPADKLDWKPDPKSRTAIELASVIADEMSAVANVMVSGRFDYDPATMKIFSSSAEAAATFKTGSDAMMAELAKMTEADWEAPAAMFMGGKPTWETTRGEMALGFLLDLIHHRGQLSTYIRPMGGKVPSIYGPSADTN